MPIDPSIALEAGKPTAPLGQANQQPNYLANPGALNTLMQMAGQKAASDAFKQSVGPNGDIDFGTFAKSIADSPQSAYAFDAMNKVLDATGKQLQQQNTRYEKGASLIAPLLLDPKFSQDNPDYARTQLHDTLTKGVNDGIIDNKTAIFFSGNLPTKQGSTSTMDVDATRKELTRAFLSILPPAELKNAITGQVINIPFGAATQPAIMNNTMGTLTPMGPPIPHAAGPGEIAEPIPAESDARGRVQSQPKGAKMPNQGGTPGIQPNPNTTGAPRVPGAPLGTGRFQPSADDVTAGYNSIQKAMERGPTAARAAFDALPPAVQAEVAKRFGGK